jgi:hypothetical protein
VHDAYERREALLEKGELLRSEQLQKRLSVSRQAISKRVGSGTLFYVDGKGGARYYPAFFADPALDLVKVKKVCKMLAPLSGAAKWLFFTSPRHPLGGASVLDVIKGVRAVVGDHTDVTERHPVSFEDVLRLACAESRR